MDEINNNMPFSMYFSYKYLVMTVICIQVISSITFVCYC